jgi:hypothetical protein
MPSARREAPPNRLVGAAEQRRRNRLGEGGPRNYSAAQRLFEQGAALSNDAFTV